MAKRLDNKSGSGRLDGDTMETASADLKLDLIASDDFGLESKLDHVADEPMDEDAIDDLPEDI